MFFSQRSSIQGEAAQPLLAGGSPASARVSGTRLRLYILLLNFSVQSFNVFTDLPINRLLEQSACKAYFDGDNRSASSIYDDLALRCKSPAIQEAAAALRRWRAVLNLTSVLLVTIPLGKLADVYGRKVVLLSSIFGAIASASWLLLMMHPIRFIWFSSAFTLLGGMSSASAMIYTMIADICPYPDRTSWFYYLHSTYWLAELARPLMAPAMTDTTTHVLVVIGIIFITICVPLILLLPETLKPQSNAAIETSSLQEPAPRDNEDSVWSTAVSLNSNQCPRESLPSIIYNRKFITGMIVLFVYALTPVCLSLLPRFVSLRLKMGSLAALKPLSAVAITNFVFFSLVLPHVIAYVISKFKAQVLRADQSIVALSLYTLGLGIVLMSKAKSMTSLTAYAILFALGFGTRPALLSLLTRRVPPGMSARVMGVVQIVEVLGSFCAGLALAALLDASQKMDFDFFDLPYLVASACYLVAGITWRIFNV